MQNRIMTVSEVLNSIENGIDLEDEIVIDVLSPNNFLEFMVLLQLNPCIKSIKINHVLEPDNFNPETARMIQAVVGVNSTLRDLDFGNTKFPGPVAKPFIKVFSRFNLDNLTMECSDGIWTSRLIHYKKNKLWLFDISVYLLNKYINNYRKLSSDKKILTALDLLQKKLEAINSNVNNNNSSSNNNNNSYNNNNDTNTGNPFERLYEALTECKNTCAVNQEFSNDFENIIQLLMDMKSYCSRKGRTPLAFLASKGMVEDIQALYDLGFDELFHALNDGGWAFIVGIYENELDTKDKIAVLNLYVKLGFDINLTDRYGENLMHWAAFKSVEMILALYKCGININQQNIYGLTPLAYAKHYNVEGDEKIKVLEDIGAVAPNFDELSVQREMFCVFGFQKLMSITKKNPTHMAGLASEGFKTLHKYFEEFSKASTYTKLPNAKEKFERIINRIKTGYDNYFLSNEELADKFHHMQSGTTQFFITGCIGHTMGASLERTSDGNYVLSLTERGYFLSHFTQEGEKYYSVKQLNIPSTAIIKTVELLKKAHASPEEIAEQILFTDIPSLAGNDFVDYQYVKQAKLKAPLCFFSNPLALVYQEITKEFGEAQGVEMFKKFTLFMRERSGAAYAPFADAGDELLMASKQIIEEKEKKFNNRFPRIGKSFGC